MITCSIVLYHTKESVIKAAITSVLSSPLVTKLFLIDNSATDSLRVLANDSRIQYHFCNENVGYGRAHNLAISMAVDLADYHLVLNPDTYFDGLILEKICRYMNEHDDVGLIMPKILYTNGSLQRLCKLLPTPSDLIGRRFLPALLWTKKKNKKYELENLPQDQVTNIPNLSGCFMFIRSKILKKTGGFDSRYFMYMEDIDLCRRIGTISKTVYYPFVSVYHGFEKASYTNLKLLLHHIISAVRYFNKWGWVFDKERKVINHETLCALSTEGQTSFKKKKILIIINRLVIGGQALDTVPLADAMRSDFEIEVLYGEKEADEAEALFLKDKYPELKIKKLVALKRSIGWINDWRAYKQIKQLIKDGQFDIVHTHGAKSGLLGRLAAWHCRVPRIFHTYHGHVFHSYYNRFFSWCILLVERMLGYITTRIITISSHQQKELTQQYKVVPFHKTVIIPLGIKMETFNANKDENRRLFRQHYKLTDDTTAIALLGRLVPVKNPLLLIEVAIRASKDQLPAVFFIIGDGTLKHTMQRQLTDNGIQWQEGDKQSGSPTVIFTSWIHDIVPSLQAMDILALTSLNEGTPLSIIEAQGCGIPVVATDAGGVKDSFVNHSSGFLVPQQNSDELYATLKKLTLDKPLRKEMGMHGQHFAAQQFSKQAEIKNYKNFYKP
jgi:glycosyltransferase involved in cell wall biosynthesis/GT2 family glycosyltransferase